MVASRPPLLSWAPTSSAQGAAQEALLLVQGPPPCAVLPAKGPQLPNTASGGRCPGGTPTSLVPQPPGAAAKPLPRPGLGFP